MLTCSFSGIIVQNVLLTMDHWYFVGEGWSLAADLAGKSPGSPEQPKLQL